MTDPVAGVVEQLEARAAAFVRAAAPGAAVGIVGDRLWRGPRASGSPDGVAAAVGPSRRPCTGSRRSRSRRAAIMQLRDEAAAPGRSAVDRIPARAASGPFGRMRPTSVALSHESGLVGDPRDRLDGTTYEDTSAQPRDVTEIGTRCDHAAKYSNLGFNCRRIVAPRRVPYVDYVRRHPRCSACEDRVRPDAGRPRGRCATGYAALPVRRARPARSPIDWAEGGLWSSVEDLGRWISFQLRGSQRARGRRCWRLDAENARPVPRERKWTGRGASPGTQRRDRVT
jgi:hypothetical protein